MRRRGAGVQPVTGGRSEKIVLAAFGAALIASLAALLLSPWPVPPLASLWVELPPLKVFQYNFNQLTRFEGGYAAFLRGWICFAAMSAWFYVCGKYLLEKILGKSGEDEFSRAELLSARWFIGTFCFSMVWLVLGTLRLFKPGIAKALIAGGIAIALWQAVTFVRNRTKRREISWNLLMPAKAALILWILGWSALCAHPVYYSDSLMINLALPGYYAAESAFVPNPFHVYSYFHQNSELLTTWALLAGSKEAAFLLVWGHFAALAVFLYGWISRAASETAAVCALALYAASDAGLWAGTMIKNDLQVGVFIVLGWRALLAAFERAEAKRWLFFSGLCGGIALGHKFNAAPAALITAAGALLYFRSQENRGKGATAKISGISALRIFALGVAAAWTPWLVRTAVLTGNPVYPFFDGLFALTGRFGMQAPPSWLTHPGTEHNLMETGWSGLIGYLRNFAQIRPAGAFKDSAIWWGPTAILCAMGLLTLTRRFAATIRWVSAIAAASWGATLFFAFKPHVYEGPMVWILCAAFGLAFGWALRAARALPMAWPRAALAFGAAAVIAVALAKSALATNLARRVMISAATIVSGSPSWHFAQGVQERTQNYSAPDEQEWIHYLVNRYAAPDDKVLFVGDVFPAGMERKHFAGLSLNLQPILFYAAQCGDANALRDKLLSLGVRHVIFDPGMWGDWIRNVTIDGPHNIPLDPKALEVAQRFLADHLQLRFKVPSEKLLWYSIATPGAAAWPPMPILPDDLYQFPYHYLHLSIFFARDNSPATAVQLLEMFALRPFDRHIDANAAKLLPMFRSAAQ